MAPIDDSSEGGGGRREETTTTQGPPRAPGEESGAQVLAGVEACIRY